MYFLQALSIRDLVQKLKGGMMSVAALGFFPSARSSSPMFSVSAEARASLEITASQAVKPPPIF